MDCANKQEQEAIGTEESKKQTDAFMQLVNLMDHFGDEANKQERESKSLENMMYCIKKLAEWKKEHADVEQSFYVVEESAEQAEALMQLIKSVTKYKRRPDEETREHLIEESCDTICTTMTMLVEMGVPVEDICTIVIGKIDRAMKRGVA